MRYSLIAISLLIILVAGASFIIEKGPSSVEKLFVSQCGILVKKLEEFNHDIGEKKSISSLKQNFSNVRKIYRRASVLMDYFFPYERKFINPPDIKRVEEDNPDMIVKPNGFQVIERILYTDFSGSSYTGLQQEVSLLIETVNKMAGQPGLDYKFSTPLVFDALKAAGIKLVSMGITGFDSPLALNSLPESVEVLQGIKDILSAYENEIPANLLAAAIALIDEGCNNLLSAKDFNSFNRLAFIRSYADPLYSALVTIITANNFQLPAERRPLNQLATSIFSPSLFDINFFSPNKRYQVTPQRIELGKLLFYDSILSPLSGRSCGSCHHPGKAFSDGIKVALPVGKETAIKRNTPTLLNAALQTRYFYDSRTATLENQLSSVVHNAAEMGGSLKESIPRLVADKNYARLFAQAYNEEMVTEYNIANAISSYVRSLVQLNSRFDKYMRGDNSALNNEEKSGFNLFAGKAKCATCHYIPLFNGLVPPEFVETESEVIGVPASAPKKNATLDDDGGKYLFTKAVVHKNAFKTPTLRNISLTAPYMHNGVYKTLEQVMDFYNKGGGAALGIAPGNQTLPAQPLSLSKREIKNIISFLGALADTGKPTGSTQPALVQKRSFIDPSGIYNYSGKTVEKNGHTYGYFGTIKVLLVDSNKIIVNFFVCKGAPSYNSGSFIDSLRYEGNRAIYRGDSADDKSCLLIFDFSIRGIDAQLFSDNPNFACGFGHAVDAEGFYKRVKRKIPTKEEVMDTDF